MKKKGFTLVELLAVVAILAILVILVMPNVLESFNHSKQETFITQVKSLLNLSTQTFISETVKGNKIEVLASSSDLYGGKNGAPISYEGKKLEYYILLDEKGNIVRYVFTDGTYSVYSTNGTHELNTTEIIATHADVKQYSEDFSITGPYISSTATQTKDALQFNFVAKDLAKDNKVSWTSPDGSTTGKIYKYENGSIKVHPSPTFVGNALRLSGREALAFTKNFRYDVFTLEATVKMASFENYTNIIANINSGGFYLNLTAQGNPGIGLYAWDKNTNQRIGYKQCHADMKLNKNELYILTASFDKHKVKLYVNGVKQKECDFPWKLGWPADNTLLAVGGNPNVGSFDDCEWFRGDLYTARIYDKVLTQNEITNNYYNNKIIANGLPTDSNYLSLDEGVSQNEVAKYQYSFDKGQTWHDYDPNDKPLIDKTTWVYARTVSRLGVISPVSTKYIEI